MAVHALKILIMFIFVMTCINFTYYATYWTYPEYLGIRRFYKKHITNNSNDPNIKIPLIAIFHIPVNNSKYRIIKTKTEWAPEFECDNNNTNIPRVATESLKHTDYRDEEDTSVKDIKPNSTCPSAPRFLGQTNWKNAAIPNIMKKVFSLLKPGGSYHPYECMPSERVAIIVPYKGDDARLLLLLFSLHLFLFKQMVYYRVFIIKEYDETRLLNHGKLFNIGFNEVLKIKDNLDWTCIIFHEGHLAPTDSRNLYRCAEQPKQLLAQIDEYRYENEFGGVIAMRPKTFRAVNGFSNMYYDTDSVYYDMYDRLIAANFSIIKPRRLYAKYNSLLPLVEDLIVHKFVTSTTPDPAIYLHTSTEDSQEDGLASLSYSVNIPVLRPSYTFLEVDSTSIIWGKLFTAVSQSTYASNYDDSVTPPMTT